MSEFLTTHAAASHIENIIMTARAKLVLVSPYFQLSKPLFERLRDADGRGVKIVIVYRKDRLKMTEKGQLAALKNLTLHFCENLHAKCYFNKDRMVLTSMNMYEFSEKNNREMGVLIKKAEDESVFTAAIEEVRSIIHAAVPQPGDRLVGEGQRSAANGPPASWSNPSRITAGFCIRCKYKLQFDPERPLCLDCFLEWSAYGNPYYVEQYCHLCGKPHPTSKDKPLCPSCFSMVFN